LRKAASTKAESTTAESVIRPKQLARALNTITLIPRSQTGIELAPLVVISHYYIIVATIAVFRMWNVQYIDINHYRTVWSFCMLSGQTESRTVTLTSLIWTYKHVWPWPKHRITPNFLIKLGSLSGFYYTRGRMGDEPLLHITCPKMA
jgi:hypothetical protein